MKTETIKRFTDEDGFEHLEVRASEGGRKTFTYYGGTSDIGFVTSMNGHGLGGSDYIRNVDDIKRHWDSIQHTTWLSPEEKGACLAFLGWIEQKAKAFMEVKERFDVEKKYVPDSRILYTFTEKEPALTMHSKIIITIEIPSGWGEGDAWRTLLKALK